jgi:hypothetical protein
MVFTWARRSDHTLWIGMRIFLEEMERSQTIILRQDIRGALEGQADLYSDCGASKLDYQAWWWVEVPEANDAEASPFPLSHHYCIRGIQCGVLTLVTYSQCSALMLLNLSTSIAEFNNLFLMHVSTIEENILVTRSFISPL